MGKGNIFSLCISSHLDVGDSPFPGLERGTPFPGPGGKYPFPVPVRGVPQSFLVGGTQSPGKGVPCLPPGSEKRNPAPPGFRPGKGYPSTLQSRPEKGYHLFPSPHPDLVRGITHDPLSRPGKWYPHPDQV